MNFKHLYFQTGQVFHFKWVLREILKMTNLTTVLIEVRISQQCVMKVTCLSVSQMYLLKKKNKKGLNMLFVSKLCPLRICRQAN